MNPSELTKNLRAAVEDLQDRIQAYTGQRNTIYVCLWDTPKELLDALPDSPTPLSAGGVAKHADPERRIVFYS